MFRTLEQADLAGKRVLVRVDFNVPISDTGYITDDRRIRATLPTIQYLLEHGASVLLISHLGRPKGQPEARYSLRQLQDPLSELLGRGVLFVEDCVGQAAQALSHHLAPGDVVLLENLRFHPEETKNDAAFAAKLASLAKVYVNDAFGAAHRAHASVSALPEQMPERYAGFLLASEVENANRVLNSAKSPFVALIGGAKVSDKLGILENLLPRLQGLIIGGGMAYTFVRAQGGQVGSSLVEAEQLEAAGRLLSRASEMGVTVLLPQDSVIADQFAADASFRTAPSDAIPEGWMGLDIGPQAVASARQLIQEARTLLWNGPLGVVEWPAFAEGTRAIALAVAETTSQGAYSLIGGGDSAAAIKQLGLESQVSYVSTGGGALLEYLEGKPLPGIAALLA